MLRMMPDAPPPSAAGPDLASLAAAAGGADPSQAPPDPTADPTAGAGADDSNKVDQQHAGYLGPEDGPFECEHCLFWEDPNACRVVAGSIDPHGCCNNYTSAAASGAGETESPEEDASEGPEASEPPQGDVNVQPQGQ